MHEFKNEYGYDETNYKGVTSVHNPNLTGRRDQQHNKPWNNFPLKQRVCIRKSTCQITNISHI